MLTDGVDTTSFGTNYADSLLWVERAEAAVFPVYFDTLGGDPKPVKNSPSIQAILNTLNIGKAAGATAAEYELGRIYLTDIARLSGGRTQQVKNINDVRAGNIGNIGAELRVQYQVSFRPSDFAAGQRKPLVVRVNRPNLFVQARGSLMLSAARTESLKRK